MLGWAKPSHPSQCQLELKLDSWSGDINCYLKPWAVRTLILYFLLVLLIVKIYFYVKRSPPVSCIMLGLRYISTLGFVCLVNISLAKPNDKVIFQMRRRFELASLTLFWCCSGSLTRCWSSWSWRESRSVALRVALSARASSLSPGSSTTTSPSSPPRRTTSSTPKIHPSYSTMRPSRATSRTWIAASPPFFVRPSTTAPTLRASLRCFLIPCTASNNCPGYLLLSAS